MYSSYKYGNICPLTIQTPVSRGGFHSATLATFDRSLRFRSTQLLPLSIRRCVEPPPLRPTSTLPYL
jgi:hypothetical protein